MATYPKNWPDTCKDDSRAPGIEGLFFRNVKHNPTNEEDFKSNYELDKPLRGKPSDECMYYGVSLFTKIEDARHHFELFPRLQNKHIAGGELTPKHGMGKATTSYRLPSHFTWWPFSEVNRAECFSIVE